MGNTGTVAETSPRHDPQLACSPSTRAGGAATLCWQIPV